MIFGPERLTVLVERLRVKRRAERIGRALIARQRRRRRAK